MKLRTVFLTLGALIALSGPLAGLRACAQDVAGDKKQAQSNDPLGLSSLLSGLNLGPMLMTFGGASGMTIDFTRSNARILLQRDDVRGALFLNSKQIEQLEDLDKSSKVDMQQKMQQAMAESFQNLQNNPDLQNLQGGSPDQVKEGLGQLKDILNQSFQKAQEVMQTFQGEQDKKAETLLTKKQLTRLHELDLQWRGPLALSDKKVAEALKTTPEQNSTVDAALKDYLKVQTTALQNIMTQLAQAGPDGGPITPGAITPQAVQGIQQKVADALQSDDIKKARKKAEDKVLGALTPDQKDQWKKMIGAHFYFRPF